VTITKSITLDGTGTFGSILSGGTNGILINVVTGNANDPLRSVRIRGLSINGAGASGAIGTNIGINGIRILAAADVYVEECVIAGFSQRGISDERSVAGDNLFVRDTALRNNFQNHIAVAPTGAGTIAVTIDNVRAERSASNTGFGFAGAVKASIRNSVADSNVHGFLATGAAEVNIVNCISSHNSSHGIFVSSPAIVRLTHSTITNNATSINVAGQPQVSSANNNVISGNTANNLPTGPALPPS
jgi:hypothetical protein